MHFINYTVKKIEVVNKTKNIMFYTVKNGTMYCINVK